MDMIKAGESQQHGTQGNLKDATDGGRKQIPCKNIQKPNEKLVLHYNENYNRQKTDLAKSNQRFPNLNKPITIISKKSLLK